MPGPGTAELAPGLPAHQLVPEPGPGTAELVPGLPGHQLAPGPGPGTAELVPGLPGHQLVPEPEPICSFAGPGRSSREGGWSSATASRSPSQSGVPLPPSVAV